MARELTTWRRKDLLGLADLTAEEMDLVLTTAESCKQIFDRPIKKFPTLRGRTVVNLFYEASTRTRTSFEIAGKWMSADVINISVSTSSVQKGESLLDTARTIQALGADIVVIRHGASGAPALLAREVKAGVINAGDGAHEHPTQGLLDLFTLRERVGRIAGLRVAIIGDVLHSRVARSNIYGLQRLGAEVAVVGPRTLMPAEVGSFGVSRHHELSEVLPWADVLMVLRLQRERHSKGYLGSLGEYSREYGLTAERLREAKKDVVVMHPGPANLGVEISDEVSRDPRSVITTQVTNGVAVRMALLYLLSGGDADGVAY